MQRIIHVLWGLTLGGIETMVVNIANAQSKLGVNVHVLIINDVYEESLLKMFNKTVCIHLLGRKQKSKNPLFIKKLNHLINEINPDVIHLHSGVFYWMLSKNNRNRIVSVTLHALPVKSKRLAGLFNRFYPMLDMKAGGTTINLDVVPTVFSISNSVHDALVSKFGIDSIIVNNGIVLSRFRRRNLIKTDKQLKMVQVGRIDYYVKGQDLTIKALSKLRGKASIDFIGDISDNYEDNFKYLSGLAEQLGVSDLVHFLGKKSQIYIEEHLCKYDLFVQPSRFEGFGLTVAEAMAADVPVLVSTGQGPEEITCGNKYGWTFENGNSDNLAQVISYIKDNYSEALEKIKKGRMHVIDTYDVEQTAKKYLNYYGAKSDNKYI